MAKDLRLRLSKEILHKLYVEDKKSLEDIARMYGVSRVAVHKYCKAEGVSRRTKSEARLEAQKKGKVPQQYFEINKHFFGSWSPEMAYVLGLLATDGCVSKTGMVLLRINDEDLLKKVAKVMNSGHPITKSTYQEGLFILMFGREELTRDLRSLGIKSRKSLDVDFPSVPGKYLRDFIRGVFDGDGSVFYPKQSKNTLINTKFCSGSESFIVGLKQSLELLGMPIKRLYCEERKNPFYYIRYCHADSLRLFKILYEDIANDLYLKRKYDKFKAVIHDE